MGNLLCIETSTSVCSVALGRDGALLAAREVKESNQHAARLTVLITQLFDEAGLHLQDLDAVAVSKGPGSYTGLRIGVSTAKGLCYGLGKPLIGISSLQAMAAGMAVLAEVSENSLLCPMIDARRMEVYMALYDMTGREIRPPVAEIINAGTFEAFAPRPVLCAGDGAAKCKTLFEGQQNILFPDLAVPSASFMITLAEQALREERFEDVAYFEPYYLKDFIAGKPGVKGLF